MFACRRLKASSSRGTKDKGPRQQQGGGSTSQLSRLVSSARGSLDVKGRCVFYDVTSGHVCLFKENPSTDPTCRPPGAPLLSSARDHRWPIP
eukprot:1149876-Pelagomonas_calceolata.AAC.1